MQKQNSNLVLTMLWLSLLLAAWACQSGDSAPPTEADAIPAAQAATLPPTAESEDPVPQATVDEPPEEPSPTEPAADLLKIDQLDPCLLVTQEDAQSVLGGTPGDPITAENEVLASCTYITVPGETFITISTYDEQGAKSFLLSDIAALQANCSGIWLNTWAGEPALSAEIEALRSESVLDLFLMDMELQASCGFPTTQLVELGENAYQFLPFGTIIGVASENAFVLFTLQDGSTTPEDQLAAAKELVRLALVD